MVAGQVNPVITIVIDNNINFFFFLLQSATILLQSATGITKYDRTESLTNSRGSRVQSRGRGSIVAAGENDLEFEVTAE